jgi:hypothetical protein
MKKRIYKFSEYVAEQEGKTSENPDLAKSTFNKLDAGGMASAMLQNAMDKLGVKDNNYSKTAETPETKASKPYVGCGTAPYAFVPVEATNKQILEDLFKDPKGRLSKDVKYAQINKLANDPNNNKLFLVGVRETLETKKREGDKFTDKMIVVNPLKPDEKVNSYQITTSPSLAYYSDPERMVNPQGTAIMEPGVSKYKIGFHKKGSPTQHEALLQSGSMDVQRYRPTVKEFDSYEPGEKESGDDFGINIHKSSTERGVCVGPYSAGCQVFADGTDFANFMSILKGATANGGEFLYALVENDNLASKTENMPDKSDDKEEKTDGEGGVEVDTEQFEDVASQIRAELDKTNSDEDKLIQMYNDLVTSDKIASKFAAFYQETYNVNVIEDLDNALSGSELKQLKHQ